MFLRVIQHILTVPWLNMVAPSFSLSGRASQNNPDTCILAELRIEPQGENSREGIAQSKGMDIVYSKHWQVAFQQVYTSLYSHQQYKYLPVLLYFTNPYSLHFWGKKLFKIVIVVPSYWNKLKQCQVNRIKKCTEWHYLDLLFSFYVLFHFMLFCCYLETCILKAGQNGCTII